VRISDAKFEFTISTKKNIVIKNTFSTNTKQLRGGIESSRKRNNVTLAINYGTRWGGAVK